MTALLSARTTIYPDRVSWLTARRDGIGGSDVSAILGLSPWTTPLQVWSEKVCLAESVADSYTLRRGSHMEGLLAAELNAELGRAVAPAEPFSIVTGAEPWMRYSPDGFLRENGEAVALVEFKSHPRGASEWSEGVPAHVVAQVQHGMFVCDLPRCYVAVDLGTEFKWAALERDPAWWPTNEPALRAFWELVETQEPPPPTGAEGDKQTLALLYPESSAGKTIALDGSFLDLAWQLDEAKAAAKKTQAAVDEIENKIRAAMGDAERAILIDGSGWTWRSQTVNHKAREAFTTEFRVLRRVAKKER